MKTIQLKKLSAIGLSLIMSTSLYAGNITNIKVTNVDADHKIVQFKFDGDFVMPQGFMTDNPPVVALEFNKTTLKLPQTHLRYDDPLLSQINAASDGTHAHVALTLNQKGHYKIERKGREVWVDLHAGEMPKQESLQLTTHSQLKITSVAEAAIPEPTPPLTAPAAAVDFQFTRNNDGGGVLRFTLPVHRSEPKVITEKNLLIIDFDNMIIPPASQQSFDVAEYATPVKKVSLRRLGNSTRLLIENDNNWAHKLMDQGSQFIVTIDPQISLFNTLDEKPVEKSFTGGKISLDFQDVDVRTILQILAKESGLNIIASDTVQGRMTLNLKDVPWDQALDLVMQARNLDMRRQGNIINIAPRAELLQQDRQIMQSQREISEMGPLVSRTFQFKYKSVEEFKAILDSATSNTSSRDNAYQRNTILSGRGSFMVDTGSNTLILTDNQSVIDKFEKLVDQLDVPVRQVMIEARIVEANDGVSRNLGMKFGYYRLGNKSSFGANLDQALKNQNSYNQAVVDTVNEFQSGGVPQLKLPEYNLEPNISLPISAPTTAIALVRSFSSAALGLELQAMQEENRGKIISSPRVLTQDRKEATIESGTEIPYQEAASSGATSTSFKKAVLGLKVTPQITPDGNVIMDIQINKDTADRSCFPAPCVNTKNLNTRAMVENGGTLIVGGIYEEDDTHAENKVPLLGDIPVLGHLFKQKSRNQSRRELLIFITPRILDSRSGTLDY